ncbi:MAG TPA: phospholipase D family protein, partial [Candidatus Nanopelagicales bacterium]
AQENRELGLDINDAGGQVLLDMRVRRYGSHHQKLVVLRHRGRPQDDVAFIGGIDLCHGRRDDAEHRGDPQAVEMAEVYGETPPWHDLQAAIRGPAVGDAELVFRERWEDPAPLTVHPVRALIGLASGEDLVAEPLPPQWPDPPACGGTAVQLLRTYPARRPAYPFATRGERSIARAYEQVLGRAQRLVYVEDQYLWSAEVAKVFAAALRRASDLRMILVIPGYPNQDGTVSELPQYAGREAPLRILREAGGQRVAIYGLENAEGVPVYVHAKTCIVDDAWACIGSDNANRRSWTNDSELSAAFVDPTCPPDGSGTAGALRRTLAREHLGAAAEGCDLDDPVAWFETFARTAAALDAWHAEGQLGPRPPGHLRAYRQPPLTGLQRLWAHPLQRVVFDPDGRPLRLRLARRRRF